MPVYRDEPAGRCISDACKHFEIIIGRAVTVGRRPSPLEQVADDTVDALRKSLPLTRSRAYDGLWDGT